MFILIWGFRHRTTTLGAGEFHCPGCQTVRPYQHKRIARYFTLYYVPIFRVKTLLEYAECGVCGGTYQQLRAEQPARAA